MAVTYLRDIVNPEVMADMISAKLLHELSLTGLYEIDRTLTGRPGDSLSLPMWNYIGMADHTPENTEIIPIVMSEERQQFTVLKATKAVVLTDEAILSGHGDPIGQATHQLTMAINERIEFDGIEQLTSGTYLTTPPQTAMNYLATLAGLGLLNNIHAAEGTRLIMSYARYLELLTDDKFLSNDELGRAAIANGSVGSVAGCTVIVVNKLPDTEAYLFRGTPMGIFMKRDITVEDERQMLFKRTAISSNCHYCIGVKWPERICKIRFA